MKLCNDCEIVEEEKNEIRLYIRPKKDINYFCKNFESEKIGFTNIGNSCYMNSILQILLHIPNFVENLKNDYKKSKNESELIQCIINLSDYPNDKKNLYSIQKYMSIISNNYEQFHQGDSQNFGIDLINEIINNIKEEGEENISSQYNKNINKNKINNYKKYKYEKFIHQYQNEEKLIALEKMFVVNEYISMNIKNKFKYSFFCNLGIELVFPDEKKGIYNLKNLLDYKYSNCNNNLKKICNIPKILIITVLRAFFNGTLNDSILKFPEELNISDYIDKDLIKKNDSLKYKLLAINEKLGFSKEYGHYFCKIKLKNQWFLFDDEKVILAENQINSSYCSKNVVGLFYINSK